MKELLFASCVPMLWVISIRGGYNRLSLRVLLTNGIGIGTNHTVFPGFTAFINMLTAK